MSNKVYPWAHRNTCPSGEWTSSGRVCYYKFVDKTDIFLQKGECYAKGHKTHNKRLLLEITGESAIIHLDRMIESQGV